MYSDAKFDVKSDFAIKHGLKLIFDGAAVVQSQSTLKKSKKGFYPRVKSIKIKYFQNEMMYFNAKFNLDSDFAIKHNLIS